MSDTLFTSQTPAAQGSDGAPGITTATTFKLANPRTCEGIQFYATATPSGTYTVALWRVTNTDAGAGGTGTLIASKAVSSAGITGNAYNIVNFAPGDVVGGESLDLDTTHLYRAGVHNGSLYVATNSFFTSALTNGDITGVQDNTDPLSNGWTIRQGTFIIDAALQYPRQVGSSASYFVGPVLAVAGSTVTAAAAQTVTLAGAGVAAVTRPATAAQTVPLVGAAAATRVAAVDAAQTVTLAGAGVAAVTRPATAAQTATFTGAADATVTTPGANAQAAQTVALAGTAVAVVIHNAQAAQVIGIAGTATPEPDAEPAIPQGNWNGLLNALHSARADHAVAEQRRRNPVECPVHGWPLEVVGSVRHCKYGGHIVRTW